MEPRIPPCPVTGAPAVRLVQWVSTRLLADLWRFEFGVDVRGPFEGLDRFGLWESPTGLFFFDPLRPGDDAFYSAFYERLRRRRMLTETSAREEFRLAATRIPAGARVLDVGCGLGAFRRFLPQADYTGIDPNLGAASGVPGVRQESLAQHLLAHAGTYDAVCCFQVIEHLDDPNAMFAGLVRAAKPGGRIFVGVPPAHSASTRIPNNLVNAPPHHLTWWTREALAALAVHAGAAVLSIDTVPWAGEEAALYWASRCSPIKAGDGVHYRGALAWHLSTLIAALGGVAANRLFGAPRTTDDAGVALLLEARRPAA